MDTVLRILKETGGWNHGLHLHIENPPYMALVIEAMDESGPCGLPVFELGFAGGPHLDPFYYRNDYVGVEQWSRFMTEDRYFCHIQLHTEQQRFAALWDKNLRQQGFAEAFARHRGQHA